MAVQADSTAGFFDEVTTAQTPAVFGHGSRYSVESPGALKVTAAGAGDRAITVAAGTDWADAVLATWNGSTVMNAAAGTRWNTLVRRTDWASETATLTLLQGGTSKALAPGVQLRNPTVSTGAGFTYADRPLYLVRTAAGSTAIQELVDLRCWSGDGGLYAASVEALQYLTTVGTQVRIGTSLWTRVLNGSGNPAWVEDAFAAPTITPGAFGSYSDGWTFDGTPGQTYMLRDGRRRAASVVLRRQGTTISIGGTGHVNDEVVRNLGAADRPIFPVESFAGRYKNGGDYGCTLSINTTGEIVLNHATPNVNIPYVAPTDWSLRFYVEWYAA